MKMTVKQLMNMDFATLYELGYDFPIDTMDVLLELDPNFVVEIEPNKYTDDVYPMTNIW